MIDLHQNFFRGVKLLTLAAAIGLAGCGGGGGGDAGSSSSSSSGGDQSGDTGHHGTGAPVTGTIVSTFAGHPGTESHVDGVGTAAGFYTPFGIAADGFGNIYVADTNNHTIRKINAAGVVSTFAGSPGVPGSADGTGAAARFNRPYGVATDTSGNVYVADTWNSAIRKINPGGMVSTFAGRIDFAGPTDGPLGVARFNLPTGIATDASGYVYVADVGNNAIRKITPGGVVSTLAGNSEVGEYGHADGTGKAARFLAPAGLTVDSAGNVYVADTLNSTIRKVTPAGVVTTFAGRSGTDGYVNGEGAAAAFKQPRGMAIDSAGNLYVADFNTNTIRKITPSGMVSTFAGSYGYGTADGPAATAQFTNPSGVALDQAGNVYVTDSSNNTIRKIAAQ